MSRSEATETIDRPAREIWAHAADIRRHPAWLSVARAEVLRGNGTQVGGQGREPIAFGPFRWDIPFEVVAADPGRSLLWRALGYSRSHTYQVAA